MRVLVTGSEGFVGKNLCVRLAELADVEVITFTRRNSVSSFSDLVSDVDFVFHLAGINRPKDLNEFNQGNTELTKALCDALLTLGLAAPIVYTSSTQAAADNPYGHSKALAEKEIDAYALESGAAIYNFRLPNVFGKWSKPNYNSAVATFCYNIANDLPIQVNDQSAPLNLVYIDDVIDKFLAILNDASNSHVAEVSPVYNTTVGEMASLIQSFKADRTKAKVSTVGIGFVRALHATYLSFLTPEQFSYPLVVHRDPRGEFSEMLKTQDSGQFSYFTAHPGITRGGHYHHTKTEKFLVLKGDALFKFKHVITGQYFQLAVKGGDARVVETVPGWTHDITNVGEEEMIVMLWANEVFDPNKPDTIALPIDNVERS